MNCPFTPSSRSSRRQNSVIFTYFVHLCACVHVHTVGGVGGGCTYYVPPLAIVDQTPSSVEGMPFIGEGVCFRLYMFSYVFLSIIVYLCISPRQHPHMLINYLYPRPLPVSFFIWWTKQAGMLFMRGTPSTFLHSLSCHSKPPVFLNVFQFELLEG